jgi:hypothetical protein
MMIPTCGGQLLPLPPNHGAAVMDSSGRDKDRSRVCPFPPPISLVQRF